MAKDESNDREKEKEKKRCASSRMIANDQSTRRRAPGIRICLRSVVGVPSELEVGAEAIWNTLSSILGE